MRQISFDVEVSLEDYIDFCSVHSKLPHTIMRVSLVLILGYSLWFGLREDLSLASLLSIAPPIIVLILLNILPIGRWMWTRAYRANPYVKEKFVFTCDGEGFQTQAATGSTSLQWKNIYKISETERVLLLYISKSQAIVLPKRFMDEPIIMRLKRLAKASTPIQEVI